MPRYYEIDIETVPSDGSAPENIKFSTLTAQGNFNPNSLSVEFDLPIAELGVVQSLSSLTIYGADTRIQKRAQSLNNARVTVRGGDTKGLPLSTGLHKGVLVTGFIFGAYGNRRGTLSWLTFMISSDFGIMDYPCNFILDWPPYVSPADSIKLALAQGFDRAKQNNLSPFREPPTIEVKVDEGRVKTGRVCSQHPTLRNFAHAVQDITKDSSDPRNLTAYSGVKMRLVGNELLVYDDSYKPPPIPITSAEMIGLAQWVGLIEIQFVIMMRSGMAVGEFVKLPNIPVLQSAASQPQVMKDHSLQGVYQIQRVRHVGKSESLNGEDWVTIVNAIQRVES